MTKPKHKGNVHVKKMLEYAEDAQFTPKPYEWWECQDIGDPEWSTLTDHPRWGPDRRYRRKVRTVRIDVPHHLPPPEYYEPEDGVDYFTIDTLSDDIVSNEWDSTCASCTLDAVRSMVFLRREDAEAWLIYYRELRKIAMDLYEEEYGYRDPEGD